MPGFSDILFVGKSANSFGHNDNCYYCSAAALLGKTAMELFSDSEVMQCAGGGFTDDIANLFSEAKAGVVLINVSTDANVAYQFLSTVTPGHGVGLEYRRADGTQHMIVAVRDTGFVNGFVNPGVKCVDYQCNPPKVTGFPPEPNLVAYRIWYR